MVLEYLVDICKTSVIIRSFSAMNPVANCYFLTE